jgi:hypothetical protein
MDSEKQQVQEIEVPQISLSDFDITKTEEQFLQTETQNIAEKKIEPSNQFVDLKTTKHLTKMNSNIMQSITDIFNAEILKFAKRVNAEFPAVPVNGILAIWCKQQKMPLSTFNIENSEDVYDINGDDDEQPKAVKVVKKKAAGQKKKKVESEELEQSVNAMKITSDAEDDVRSSDEEVEHGKPKKTKKKEAAPKKEGEKCQHMYVKGKNANTQCVTTVKGGGDYCSKHKQNK